MHDKVSWSMSTKEGKMSATVSISKIVEHFGLIKKGHSAQ